MSSPPEVVSGRRVLPLPFRRRRKETPGPWFFLKDLPRVFPYLRPYWKLGLGAGAMSFSGLVTGLLSPWPFAILVDTVLGNEPLPSILGPLLGGLDKETLLVIAVLGGLLVTVIENGATVLDNYINTKLEERMTLDLRSDLFQHAQRLSLAFHDQRSTGGLMYQINNQAGAVGAITVAIAPLAQAVLMLGAMFAIVYTIDPMLALLSLTVLPAVYLSSGYYAKKIEPRLMHVRSLEGQSLSIVHEAMAMLRVIVAFGREHHEYTRFREQSESAVNARVNVTVRQTLFSLGVNTLTASGTALVLGVGAWQVLQKQLTVGELLVVMGYVAAIYDPLQQISLTLTQLQESFIGLRHSFELLETEPEVKERPNAVAIGRARGEIFFDDVSFSYPKRPNALQNISFRADPGARFAIVGRTGAGKSTLVSLIARFFDPESGRILLDGVDLRDLTLSSLRAQISIVLQEPLLFSGSIAANIRYGRLEATDDEIEEAAHAANAHEFISQLPKGYETEIGERGAQLAGGERQRIAVARAFLKDAPILILDEPTSAIDSKTEAVILDALEGLMKGRTTFLIAHRLSTIRHADFVVVLDKGRVVEQGEPADLLASGGLYKQLHDAQAARAGKRVRPVDEPRHTPERPFRDALVARFLARLEASSADGDGRTDALLSDVRTPAGTGSS